MLAPEWLDLDILDQVIRVDLGLEGDWSETVAPLWDREHGFMGLPETLPSHSRFRPCLELYLEGGWIGIHCFRHTGDAYVLHRARALAIVELVQNRVGGSQA